MRIEGYILKKGQEPVLDGVCTSDGVFTRSMLVSNEEHHSLVLNMACSFAQAAYPTLSFTSGNVYMKKGQDMPGSIDLPYAK